MAKPSGETSTARGRARREELLDVALRAFAAQGYRGASIGAIAREAGISEPGLIHYFPSKRDLLFGVLGRFSLYLRQADDRFDENGRSFCDALLSVARVHEADSTIVRAFVVLAAESVNPDHPAHEYFRAGYEALRAGIAVRFASDQERGFVVPQADPELMARVVISILDGLALQHLLSDGDLQIVEPLEAFLDTLQPQRP